MANKLPETDLELIVEKEKAELWSKPDELVLLRSQKEELELELDQTKLTLCIKFAVNYDNSGNCRNLKTKA